MSVQDDLNGIMWAGFIRFSWGEPACRAAFTAETGVAIPTAPTSAIEALIDQAAGVWDSVAAQFVEWLTVNHWGIEHAPKSYRDHLASKPCPWANEEQQSCPGWAGGCYRPEHN